MRKWIVLIAMLIMAMQSTAQSFHRNFLLEIRHGMRPTSMSGKDSLNMMLVAVTLAPDGRIVSTEFSSGLREEVKDDIKARLGRMGLKKNSTANYWKKYCQDNNITNNTVFLQATYLRMKKTDEKFVAMPELTDKFEVAMTLGDSSLFFKRDVNVVWLPPMVRVIEEVVIKD